MYACLLNRHALHFPASTMSTSQYKVANICPDRGCFGHRQMCLSEAQNEYEVVLISRFYIMHPVLAFASQSSSACGLGKDPLLPSFRVVLTPSSSSSLFLFLPRPLNVTAEVPMIPVRQALSTSAMIHDLGRCNFRQPFLSAASCQTMIALAVTLREIFLPSGQIRRPAYIGTRHKMDSNWTW